MNKQQLITVFSIATLVNGLGQEKISIIGSSVVINNFESKLNIYNKNYSDKNLQKYKGRIIIMVKNNYKENDNIVLENKFFLKTSYLNLGVYYNTYSDIFFTKDSFKINKDKHNNHLIENITKDKKILLNREKILSINPKIYVLYCKYLYLYN